MTVQKDRKFSGGAGLAEKGGLDLDLQDAADDFATLKTAFNDLLAKLDTEGGLGGGYVTALEVGDLKTTKG